MTRLGHLTANLLIPCDIKIIINEWNQGDSWLTSSIVALNGDTTIFSLPALTVKRFEIWTKRESPPKRDGVRKGGEEREREGRGEGGWREKRDNNKINPSFNTYYH